MPSHAQRANSDLKNFEYKKDPICLYAALPLLDHLIFYSVCWKAKVGRTKFIRCIDVKFELENNVLTTSWEYVLHSKASSMKHESLP